MHYRIAHTINTDVDTFWNSIFFETDYNRALFVDELRFDVYKVLEETRDADGTVRRKIDSAPRVELPAALKKLTGGNTGYIETGHFDPAKKVYDVDVVTHVLPDKGSMQVKMWAEARGDKRCERIVEVEHNVKIFGLGKVLEKFVEKEMRETYRIGADFTNRWIADKGL